MHDVSPQSTPVALFDKRAVAQVLGCSVRHIDRLRQAGKMPTPICLGRLVRWPRAIVNDWIAAGCPPDVRQGGGDE